MDKKAITLKLKSFEDELPELTSYSSSYGGQWSSDWIVVFSAATFVLTTQYVVKWSHKHEPVTEEAKKMGNLGGDRYEQRLKNKFWCYAKDVKELIEAAHGIKGEA